MQEEKRKVCIYFRVNDYALIKKIKERFGIKEGITVNGECNTEIRVNDWDVFRETERRGFFEQWKYSYNTIIVDTCHYTFFSNL